MTTPKEKRDLAKMPESNPVLIESNHDLCKPILKYMQLIDLHQVKFDAIRLPRLDKRKKTDPISIESSDDIQLAFNKKNNGIVAIISVGITGMTGNDKIFQMSATYRVVYVVKKEYEGDLIEKRSMAFCQISSMAHIWPYWREALSSACARMGLPPIIAPLLIVGAKSHCDK